MKLKTLKDCNDLNDARKLAIKWIKEFRKAGVTFRDYDFKRFFEITREDLEWVTQKQK